MAGLTTHLIICFVGFVISYILLRNWKYGFAFVIGHLIPDLISFGVTGLKMGSLDPGVIMTNSWFGTLAGFSHNPFNWIILATVIWVIALLLYNFKKISEKNFLGTVLGLVLFIIGTTLHLIMDKLIIETNYWI